MGIGLNTYMQVETRSEQAIQSKIRSSLEEDLETIREITNLYIGDIENFIEEMINIYTRTRHSMDKIILQKAIGLGIELHSKGKEAARESGDPYIIHPLQTGEVLVFMGEDARAIAGGILHDSIENNYEKRIEVMKKIYKRLGEEVLFLVMGVTAKPIEDSSLKKKLLSQQIQDRSPFIHDQKLHKIRYADRLTNLLTLYGLKSKNGVSAEERRKKIIEDTIENILRKAKEIDEKCNPILNLYSYMKDITDKYQTKKGDVPPGSHLFAVPTGSDLGAVYCRFDVEGKNKNFRASACFYDNNIEGCIDSIPAQ